MQLEASAPLICDRIKNNYLFNIFYDFYFLLNLLLIRNELKKWVLISSVRQLCSQESEVRHLKSNFKIIIASVKETLRNALFITF